MERVRATKSMAAKTDDEFPMESRYDYATAIDGVFKYP